MVFYIGLIVSLIIAVIVCANERWDKAPAFFGSLSIGVVVTFFVSGMGAMIQAVETENVYATKNAVEITNYKDLDTFVVKTDTGETFKPVSSELTDGESTLIQYSEETTGVWLPWRVHLGDYSKVQFNPEDVVVR